VLFSLLRISAAYASADADLIRTEMSILGNRHLMDTICHWRPQGDLTFAIVYPRGIADTDLRAAYFNGFSTAFGSTLRTPPENVKVKLVEPGGHLSSQAAQSRREAGRRATQQWPAAMPAYHSSDASRARWSGRLLFGRLERTQSGSVMVRRHDPGVASSVSL